MSERARLIFGGAACALLLACSADEGRSPGLSVLGGEGTGTAPPPEYYAALEWSSPAALRATLHETIDDHVRFDYTDDRDVDTWDILEEAQQDPLDSDRVIDIYRNASFARAGGGNGGYNREHSWPKSLGFPRDGKSNLPYTDCHALFLSDSSYNSGRNNKRYDVVDSASSRFSTEPREGGPVIPALAEADDLDNLSSAGAWQTWHGRRGDVARAQLYLDVRYEGGTHVSGAKEPDLRLTDDPSQIRVDSDQNQAVAYMGRRSALLRWHLEDPVDELERWHNAVVASYQGNRNPFVDHPEWVGCIFEERCGLPWINELHYDDRGTDDDEQVEVAGRAGTSLQGWSLVLYDGSVGEPYRVLALAGALPEERDGHGAMAVDAEGLRNGVGGVALVDPEGMVVDFVSYGGTFLARAAEAEGMRSRPLGVTESNDTDEGRSLQLTGEALGPGQLRWVEGPASPGALNDEQVLIDVGMPPVGMPPVGMPPADVPPTTGSRPWVNELHYEDVGEDEGEFVELAGPPGLELAGWSVVLYNGNTGAPYQTLALAGALSSSGHRALEVPGMQNGPVDGLALVDPDGVVVEFWSYEGQLTATSGPAEGMVSTDLGVAESGTTAEGMALGRVGEGEAGEDFPWSVVVASPGMLNPGQVRLDQGP